ncbi:sugar ABC transporter substrate-binding protein [Arcanobacterium phocae]|uniref:sugar ABC transporter substrate-binding protein n=1 Tax=Arcanobacterium phocae TaxID=131112 RepID=UPI001C10C6F0|nr:maltose ABC transporter substrate-binding protein [Arcanobacterium phocae]
MFGTSFRKMTFLCLTAALTLSGVGACSQGQSAERSEKKTGGELTVWVDAGHIDAIKTAATSFTKKTGVDVKLVQKEFGSLQQDLITQVPAGKGPDISIGPDDWTGLLAADGVIQTIELGASEAKYEKVAVDAFKYEGKTYGVPYSIENVALIRNKKLAPEAPKDWADMKAMGKAAGTEYPYLVQVGDKGDPYTLYPVQTSFGSFVFGQNDDGSYNPSQLTIGDQHGTDFANWMKQETEEGLLSTSMSADIAISKFTEGASPFIISGPWNIQAIQKAEMDFAVEPVPSAGGMPARPFVGVQGFFLTAKTQNKIAATNFLTNYIGTKDIQVDLFKAGGNPPALKDALAEVASDPIVQGFAEAGKNGVPLPNITEMSAVWESWNSAEVAIVNKQGEAQEIWAKMADDIAKTLKK